MIIQRLASALKRQDWLQVIIEIFIVIIGIYLGLQVQAWDQERQDRAAGELYISQIKEDIASDLLASRQMLSTALPLKQRTLSAVEEMVKTATPIEISEMEAPLAINRPGDAPIKIQFDSFRALEFSTIFSWSFPQIKTTTYDDLQNSGKLSLIDDDNLRFMISDYYDNSRNANNRVIQRVTGYGSYLYKMVGGGARTAFTHSSSNDRLRFDQSGFNPNISLQVFFKRANTEEFQEFLRAETNYTAFMFDMTQEQINRIEVLLEALNRGAE